MISFDSWITQFGVADQTNIVWKLLSYNELLGKPKFSNQIEAFVHDRNTYASVICYNLYYAWCGTTQNFLETEDQTYTTSFSELSELFALKKEFERFKLQVNLIGNTYEDKLLISKYRTKISALEEEIKRKKQGFVLLKRYTKWILITDSDVANILVRFKLPVVYYEKSYWWGYFLPEINHPYQNYFYEKLNKIKIFPNDSIHTVVSKIYKVVGYKEEKTFWEQMVGNGSKRNFDSNHSRNVSYILNASKGESLNDREIRLDLSNSFVKFLEDLDDF